MTPDRIKELRFKPKTYESKWCQANSIATAAMAVAKERERCIDTIKKNCNGRWL